MKIKKGDKVMVISGKYKGTTGVVTEAIPEKNSVIVEKVNVHKKSNKPTQENPEGGIVEIELPIHISKVMLTNGNKADKMVVSKVTYRIVNGKKTRILAKTREEV